MIGIDWQHGFGSAQWTDCPEAPKALANWLGAADAWRIAGGTVINVYTEFTKEAPPQGNLLDFRPDADKMLGYGSPGAALYDGIYHEKDIQVLKKAFCATTSSDILSILREKGITTAVLGGLTTQICVQTTTDELSQQGIKCVVLEDGCAAQVMGRYSAQEAHDFAIARMQHVFAQILSTGDFIGKVKAL